MRFVSKLLESNLLLTKKLIDVNGIFKQKNYLVRVNDIIKSTPKKLKNPIARFFTKKWRLFL
jgi:hypothetical protein